MLLFSYSLVDFRDEGYFVVLVLSFVAVLDFCLFFLNQLSPVSAAHICAKAWHHPTIGHTPNNSDSPSPRSH